MELAGEDPPAPPRARRAPPRRARRAARSAAPRTRVANGRVACARSAAGAGSSGSARRLEEGRGQARRRHDAERVAVERRVLGRDPARLARRSARAAARRAASSSASHGRGLAVAARRELAGREVADPPQQIGERPPASRARRSGASPCELRLDRLDRARVEQVAQLLLPEQVAQHGAVERQRLRAALGRGRVALVEVGRRVGEHERARERRGRRASRPRRRAPRAPRIARSSSTSARHVEDVLQTAAVGLEHDREARELARHREQVLRAQALHPERRARCRGGGAAAAARAPRSRGTARRRAPSGRAARRPGPRPPRDRAAARRGPAARSASAKRSTMPSSLQSVCTSKPASLREARLDRERPRRVHARAEGREDADAPVAELVAEALDRDRAVGRQRAGRRALLREVVEQVRARRARRGRHASRSHASRLAAAAARRARARRRRARGRARAAAPVRRRARTAAGRPRPAPAPRSRDRA